MPPITTIAKIIAQQHSSQIATARNDVAPALVRAAGSIVVAVGKATRCKCQQMTAETRSLVDAAYKPPSRLTVKP
jgi:hypothetical protein